MSFPIDLAQTVSPLAPTAHASLADNNVETAHIPAPPTAPTALLASYLAGDCFIPLDRWVTTYCDGEAETII